MKHKKAAKIMEALCSHLGFTAYQLSKELGYKSLSSIYHVMSGDVPIGSRMAARITHKYPQISYNYLIGNSGDLLATKEELENVAYLNAATTENSIDFKKQFRKLVADVQEIKRQNKIIIDILSK